MNAELKQLLNHIKTSGSTDELVVMDLVNAYFKAIIWSNLKAEWSRMSLKQRCAFVRKAINDTK